MYNNVLQKNKFPTETYRGSMIDIQSPVRFQSNDFHHSANFSKALNHQQTKEQRSCHPSSTDLRAPNFSMILVEFCLCWIAENRPRAIANNRKDDFWTAAVFSHQNHAFLPLLTGFGPIQGANSKVNTGGPTRCRTASKQSRFRTEKKDSYCRATDVDGLVSLVGQNGFSLHGD